MAQYLPILTMIVLVILFVSVSFFASILLTSKRPTAAKTAPYECGIVPEQELPADGPVQEEGWDFFTLDKEEVLELARTAARDPKPLAEWSFWPEGIREPVELSYAGPGGTWALRFGALLAEPEVLGVQAR